MNLIIKVVGRARTGKTTIAELIYRALENEGFNVEMNDEHPPNEGVYDGCLRVMKEENASIRIEQHQIQKRVKLPCKHCGELT